MHFLLFCAYKYNEAMFVNDLTPMFILFLLTNKNGFNSIKNAIEAADNFSSKINNMSNLFSMLPNLTGLFNNISSQGSSSESYIDTLKNFSEFLK